MPRIIVRVLLSGGIIHMPSLTNMKGYRGLPKTVWQQDSLLSGGSWSHVGPLRDPVC
jgi:hypothetical protein